MSAVSTSRRGWSTFLFVVLMLALTGIFIALGIWQVLRLAEKEALIATVAERMTLPPEPLPAASDWSTTDWEVLNYRAVSVTGTWLPGASIRVFTSLSDAKGQDSGPGYWIMTPVALESGGTIMVNRGFMPQSAGTDFDPAAGLSNGPMTLSGIVQPSEAASSFTPVPDTENRIDWVRDTGRLAAMAGELPRPLAPVFIDLPAGHAGSSPQGGETVVEFPNNHLGYAITWFGFALLTPVLLIYWLIRQKRAVP